MVSCIKCCTWTRIESNNFRIGLAKLEVKSSLIILQLMFLRTITDLETGEYMYASFVSILCYLSLLIHHVCIESLILVQCS